MIRRRIKSKRRRDFTGQTYRNPFLIKKKSAITFPGKVLFILFLGICISFFYLLFYSPIFKIENIEILPTQYISREKIRSLVEAKLNEARFIIFKQNNLLIFDKEDLQKTITADYVLEDLRILKRPFHTLKIEIIEKKELVIWSTHNRFYHLDINGIVIKELPQFIKISEEISPDLENDLASLDKVGDRPELQQIAFPLEQNLPLVYDLSNSEVQIGEKLTTSQVIEFIIKAREKISKETQIKIVSFEMSEPQSKDLISLTQGGWKIYFDVSQDQEEQLDNLILIYNEKIRKENIELEYIDLRFGGRVYYRPLAK